MLLLEQTSISLLIYLPQTCTHSHTHTQHASTPCDCTFGHPCVCMTEQTHKHTLTPQPCTLTHSYAPLQETTRSNKPKCKLLASPPHQLPPRLPPIVTSGISSAPNTLPASWPCRCHLAADTPLHFSISPAVRLSWDIEEGPSREHWVHVWVWKCVCLCGYRGGGERIWAG